MYLTVWNLSFGALFKVKMLHHLKKKTNKHHKNLSLIKTQGEIFNNHQLPL